jgi:alpha-tubulin suppressor-like RCC1 family protein
MRAFCKLFKSAYWFAVVLLVSCGGGGGGGNASVSSSNSSESAAKIIDFKRTDDVEILSGNTIRVNATCSYCDSKRTAYEWYIGNNPDPVSNDEQYKIKETDRYQVITVVAIPYSNSGVAGQKETMKVYRNEVIRVVGNESAFVAVKVDGTAYAWGNSLYGGETGYETLTDIAEVVGNTRGFVALKKNGHIVTWGSSISGYPSNFTLDNVTNVFANETGFAALKSNGAFVVLGAVSDLSPLKELNSGVKKVIGAGHLFIVIKEDNTAFVVTNYNRIDRTLSNVVDVAVNADPFTSLVAFAFLKQDGSVLTEGDWARGGDPYRLDLTGVSRVVGNGTSFTAIKADGTAIWWTGGDSKMLNYDLTKVKSIVTTDTEFLALNEDGRAFHWGNEKNFHGHPWSESLTDIVSVASTREAFALLRSDGTLALKGRIYLDENTSKNLTNIQSIVSNEHAFTALSVDGRAFSFGDARFGGDSRHLNLDDVTAVFPNGYAFAALKKDGNVVAWGSPTAGGDSRTDLFDDVVDVVGNQNAAAILKSNGSVVTWGSPESGGETSALDLSSIRTITPNFNGAVGAFAAIRLDGTVVSWGAPSIIKNSVGLNLTNVTTVIGNGSAYAAIKSDGSVVTWGNESKGGLSTGKNLNGTQRIIANKCAFLALKADGEVVTWGGGDFCGGNSQSLDLAGIHSIVSTSDNFFGAFAAIKQGGEVVAWGSANHGGDLQGQSIKDVTELYATNNSFIGVRSDRSLVTWGGDKNEGISKLQNISGIVSVKTAGYSVLALKSDGTVVSSYAIDNESQFVGVESIVASGKHFAVTKFDGTIVCQLGNNNWDFYPFVKTPLSRTYSLTYVNSSSFAFLTKDGEVGTCGEYSTGGYSGHVVSKLKDIEKVFPVNDGFVAISKTGKAVTWGGLPTFPDKLISPHDVMLSN